jgi:predicted tellurium resistance membrane protein TerC
VLQQTTASTLRAVGILLILFLVSVLVFKFAQKNWVWYPLLAILLVIATWSAWLASQSTPMTLLVLFGAVAIASLLTLWRNRKRRKAHARDVPH